MPLSASSFHHPSRACSSIPLATPLGILLSIPAAPHLSETCFIHLAARAHSCVAAFGVACGMLVASQPQRAQALTTTAADALISAGRALGFVPAGGVGGLAGAPLGGCQHGDLSAGAPTAGAAAAATHPCQRDAGQSRHVTRAPVPMISPSALGFVSLPPDAAWRQHCEDSLRAAGHALGLVECGLQGCGAGADVCESELDTELEQMILAGMRDSA